MTTAAATPLRVRRSAIALLAAVTAVTGLLVHTMSSCPAGDIAGDALYAALLYLLVALIAPRWHPIQPALVSAGICTAVELLQLTHIPRDLSAAFPPAALVLGSGFDPRDLVVYVLAAAAASGLDVAVTGALRRRGR
ncbi:DUF2809 domain-containing protein [Streptomyces sp. AC495_CC817]|uniref:ribosomal maturation YjgA family protein n=1 Tax=Streptomyces sp. AC495_CC817 TaxID=2823900 RepID=UPI001C27178D|nr:DUF2809 domain-containing protein [Streptomyces sp. AC495_CC817]